MRHGTPIQYVSPSEQRKRIANQNRKVKPTPIYSKYNMNHQPSRREKFAAESASAAKSSTSALVFPWNLEAECYMVEDQLPQELSNGVNLEMINALFRDITQSRISMPFRENGLVFLGSLTGILGLALLFTYVITGNVGDYYNYEVQSDSDKRFITKTAKSRSVDVWIVVGALVIILITVTYLTICGGSDFDEQRLRIRSRALLKTAKRHEETTFANTGCTISLSSMGAVLTIKMKEPVVDFEIPREENNLGKESKGVEKPAQDNADVPQQ